MLRHATMMAVPHNRMAAVNTRAARAVSMRQHVTTVQGRPKTMAAVSIRAGCCSIAMAIASTTSMKMGCAMSWRLQVAMTPVRAITLRLPRTMTVHVTTLLAQAAWTRPHVTMMRGPHNPVAIVTLKAVWVARHPMPVTTIQRPLKVTRAVSILMACSWAAMDSASTTRMAMAFVMSKRRLDATKSERVTTMPWPQKTMGRVTLSAAKDVRCPRLVTTIRMLRRTTAHVTSRDVSVAPIKTH